MLTRDPTAMSRKRLEQIRGFIMHIAQTYPFIASYMIGIHMTIDGWREGRDAEEWRVKQKSTWEAVKDEDGWIYVSHDDAENQAPVEVKAVPRLESDIEALQVLTKSREPPLRRVRCRKTTLAYYGFADASGRGFGATFQIGNEIFYEYGQWSSEVSEKRSSNWRELDNLVETMEGFAFDNQLAGCEVFLFTDNSTAEHAFSKGTSKSRLLYELVLRLRRLEIEYDLQLRVVHVSGKRMIAQGTDGL